MSWTRSRSVPLNEPHALWLDQEGHEGDGGKGVGHDGRGLWHGVRRTLPNGSDGQGRARARQQGGHGGVLRQELDVSTDLLDLGTEPNPWWSEGVQREHLHEARQLAVEQPMWMPREEVSVKEDLPEIEDADASRELEPLAMGRMSAPSSWSTRRGAALQTQGAMPPDDDEDLRHPQDAGQGRREVHPQGVDRQHPQDVGQGQDLRYPQDAGQGHREVHPQGVDRQHPQDVGQGQGLRRPQDVGQGRHAVHPQGADRQYPQDAGQGQREGHPQGVEKAGHHRGVAAGLLAGEVQRSGKGHGQGRVVQPNGMGGEVPSHGVGKQGGQTGGLGGEIPVQRSDIMQEAGHHRGVSRDGPSRSEVDVQWTGRHRGVSHGYGPERRQVQGHRTVPSGLRDQSQRRVHRQDDGSPLERVPMGVQQYEMRRQMPREASRQPQGEVRGARNFVDDVNQQGRDERDELKRALEQSMVEELHRQKLEMEKQQAEMKKYAEDLQRQRDEFEKQADELKKELKKKSSSVDPPRTPPRRPQYYSLSPRTTPGGTQVPPGKLPLEAAELPELPPWQFDPFAVDEHVGGGTGFDGLEDFWTPVEQQQQQHRPQHGADRFACLDREVRMMHGERPRLTGEYWEQPVHRYGGPPADFGYMSRNHHHNHLKDMEMDLVLYQCMQRQCNMVQCHCNGNNLNHKQKVLMVKLLKC